MDELIKARYFCWVKGGRALGKFGAVSGFRAFVGLLGSWRLKGLELQGLELMMAIQAVWLKKSRQAE